jgi:hypothetical protein
MTMLDRILAVLSLLALILFLSIVVRFVDEPALWVVILIVVAMAAYDFWRAVGPKKSNGTSSE